MLKSLYTSATGMKAQQIMVDTIANNIANVNTAGFKKTQATFEDLLYVTYGAILACGIDPDPVFAEVHRANLSKAGGPTREDGKVLKPPGWQPADVRSVIEKLVEETGE